MREKFLIFSRLIRCCRQVTVEKCDGKLLIAASQTKNTDDNNNQVLNRNDITCFYLKMFQEWSPKVFFRLLNRTGTIRCGSSSICDAGGTYHAPVIITDLPQWQAVDCNVALPRHELRTLCQSQTSAPYPQNPKPSSDFRSPPKI